MRLPILAIVLLTLASDGHAETTSDRARRHFQEGKRLATAGSWEAALSHLMLAWEATKQPEYLFAVANCEYMLGRFKDAHAHYTQYVRDGENREALEIARGRLEAIDNRKSVLDVNSDPDEVEVRLDGPETLTGQGPNDFEVKRGRYRVTVSKRNYQTETREVELGIAETKSIFVRLKPIPARLVVRTLPRTATLYVRGNRARNPYEQAVEPGSYELYAEATDYAPRREVLVLSPGEHRVVDFALPYVQRSGRPELIWFWTATGAVAGGAAVAARLESLDNPASGSLVLGGALAGGIGGAVISTALTPSYIRDNQALFRIGAQWVGAVEGAFLGLALAGDLSITPALLGGVLGLGAGTTAGVLFDDRAPTYGRVALIQSAAAWGTLTGAAMVAAVRPEFPCRPAPCSGEDQGRVGDYFERWTPIGILLGLNAGLGAGLAMAYLPDQRLNRPSWQRVALVDLAGAAGAFAGAIATTLESCLAKPDEDCGFASDQRTAAFAIGGATLGLAAGWLLTRNFDRSAEPVPTPVDPPAVSLLPAPAALPVQTATGFTLVPGISAQGRF